MRIPRARFGSQFSPVVFAILVVSTLSARADNAIDKRSSSPPSRMEHLVLTPANLRFGKVGIGRRSRRAVTIANWGQSSITFSQVITKGRDFTVSGLDLPLTLARGESFTFKGVFAPRSRGEVHGSISFVSGTSGTAKPTLSLALAGTGDDADQLIVHPVSMDFGDVLVGSYANQTGKLTASGDSVTILSANSSSPEFTLSGLPFPLTIPAGESVEYTVTFTPDDTGAVFASLAFIYDGGSSMAVQSLTGIGDVANSHSVDLSWNASTSVNVIGYNVYRSKTSGGHYRKINSVLIASTVYTDTSVVDGYTYYYVATAVNSSDQESAYSNEARAIIPTAHPGVLGYTRSPAFSRKMPMTGALSGRH
jgi:Abnormal spindle-like microcephaly-assoc'd, ASPM-SPD-2-Hydin